MKRNLFDVFLKSLVTDFEYAYATIKDSKTNDVLCEGFVNSIQKIFDIRVLKIRSFKIFEVEDGSILVDIYV